MPHQHKRPRHDSGDRHKESHNDDARGDEVSAAEAPTARTDNPFMPMFNTFREELDEHHDRRERVIKASRDITALSKKMIFTMQRTRTLTPPLPPFIANDISQRTSQIHALFTSILSDIPSGTLNSHRYQRNISGGIQEYLEAASFHHYLTTGTLLSLSQAQASLPQGINVTVEDYMGGMFDLVGEVMRLGITMIATTPWNSSKEGRVESPKTLNDLREFRAFFEDFGITGGGLFGRGVEKKLGTMRQSVEKVEMAVYGMFVRGRERPAGWVPDVSGHSGGGGRGDRDDDDA